MPPHCGRSSLVGRGAAVLIIAAVQLCAPYAAPVASAADCADAEVIFARGTDEPDGLGSVGGAFVDSIRAQSVGLKIESYAVDYDAGKLQLGTGDGAKDVIKRIKATSASCPETKIVLGGYSQGANVINIVAGNPIVGIAWGASLPAADATNVAAIATFGNVANRSGTKLPNQSAMFAGKGIDLCHPADPICHAGSGNEWSGHTDGYVPGYTTQAATFVASKLMVGTSQSVPGLGPLTGYDQLPGYGRQPSYSQPPGYVNRLPGPAPEVPVYASQPEGSDHMPPGWEASAPGVDPSLVTGLP